MGCRMVLFSLEGVSSSVLHESNGAAARARSWCLAVRLDGPLPGKVDWVTSGWGMFLGRFAVPQGLWQESRPGEDP